MNDAQSAVILVAHRLSNVVNADYICREIRANAVSAFNITLPSVQCLPAPPSMQGYHFVTFYK